MSTSINIFVNIIDKIFIVVLVASILFFISPGAALATFIVLGQGHFILSYIYKIKSGTVHRYSVMLFLTLALVLLVLIQNISFDTLLIGTAILFALHFFFDELRIIEEHHSSVSIFILIPPILMFIVTLLYLQQYITLMTEGILISIALYIIAYIRRGIRVFNTPYAIYSILFTLFFIAIFYFKIRIFPENLFGAIIVIHIITWYIFQYKKHAQRNQSNIQYVCISLFVNLLLFLLFLLYKNNFSIAIYAEYLFTPTYYYYWAILHILSTSSDLQNFLHSRTIQKTSLKQP